MSEVRCDKLFSRLSLQPGINRYNLQAANLVREQLERSQALMCLQTESLERQHSTTAAGVPQ